MIYGRSVNIFYSTASGEGMRDSEGIFFQTRKDFVLFNCFTNIILECIIIFVRDNYVATSNLKFEFVT